uniref:alpha-L-fucosidase n=1 Tax=Pithovirus LCPAC404 TaxID=2506597 RepID=A0A481ZG92_9VIRU|nr:MAG: alpha-L-fucosidase [Pithovirus LCPAC404]
MADSSLRSDEQLKFGIFMHWGIYSIPAYNPERKVKKLAYNGSEWYLARLKNTFLYKKKTVDYHAENYPGVDYHDFLQQFEEEVEQFDSEKLMDIIEKTGAQYIVITTKHHDGVSLYPSKYGRYHTTRDLIGEIAESARKRGIVFGLYYSLMEWTPDYSRGYKKVRHYITNVMIPQMKELVEKYKPRIFWTDGDWNHKPETWKTVEFLDWLFEESSVRDFVTINDRWGKKNTVSDDPKYKDRMVRNMGDRYIPERKEEQPWEHCTTVSQSWGYARNQKDTDYKTPRQLELLMGRVLKKGGRLLLNVGLRPDGTMDPKEQKALEGTNFKKCLKQ